MPDKPDWTDEKAKELVAKLSSPMSELYGSFIVKEIIAKALREVAIESGRPIITAIQTTDEDIKMRTDFENIEDGETVILFPRNDNPVHKGPVRATLANRSFFCDGKPPEEYINDPNLPDYYLSDVDLFIEGFVPLTYKMSDVRRACTKVLGESVLMALEKSSIFYPTIIQMVAAKAFTYQSLDSKEDVALKTTLIVALQDLDKTGAFTNVIWDIES